jgi:hypothetical protein
MFAPIRDDRELFEAVTVGHEFGTITWPGAIDLDSDVLRADEAPASGAAPPPAAVLRPARAAGLGVVILQPIERWIGRRSPVGDTPFYDVAHHAAGGAR